jgi:hypothetical protein
MTQEQINGIVPILALVRPAPGRGRVRATCPAITPALASDPGLELPAAREPLPDCAWWAQADHLAADSQVGQGRPH